MAMHSDRFTPFDTTTASRLGQAFDSAWDEFAAAGEAQAFSEAQIDELREALALRIIKLAQDGERDPAHLRDAGLAYVKARAPRAERHKPAA